MEPVGGHQLDLHQHCEELDAYHFACLRFAMLTRVTLLLKYLFHIEQPQHLSYVCGGKLATMIKTDVSCGLAFNARLISSKFGKVNDIR